MNRSRDVAILIFDDVEVLDFCGPFEVFSVAGREDDLNPLTVYTVAEKSGPIMARNHLSVNPTYTFLDCPQPHILVVPGGYVYPPGNVQYNRDREKKDRRPMTEDRVRDS